MSTNLLGFVSSWGIRSGLNRCICHVSTGLQYLNVVKSTFTLTKLYTKSRVLARLAGLTDLCKCVLTPLPVMMAIRTFLLRRLIKYIELFQELTGFRRGSLIVDGRILTREPLADSSVVAAKLEDTITKEHGGLLGGNNVDLRSLYIDGQC